MPPHALIVTYAALLVFGVFVGPVVEELYVGIIAHILVNSVDVVGGFSFIAGMGQA